MDLRLRLRTGILPGQIALAAWLVAASVPPADAHEDEAGSPSSRPPTTGPVVTDAAIPQELGTWTLVLPITVPVLAGQFAADWSRTPAGRQGVSLFLPAQLYYGAFARTEISLLVPLQANWVWNVHPPGPGGQTAASTGGIGDISLAVKRLVVQTKTPSLAVAVTAIVRFPSGSARRLNPAKLRTDLIGIGTFAFTLGVNTSLEIDRLIIYGDVWYIYVANSRIGGIPIYIPSLVRLNLAAEYRLARKWGLLVELLSNTDAGRLFGPPPNLPRESLMTLLSAVEFLGEGRWSVDAGIRIDLAGRNNPILYGPVVSVVLNF